MGLLNSLKGAAKSFGRQVKNAGRTLRNWLTEEVPMTDLEISAKSINKDYSLQQKILKANSGPTNAEISNGLFNDVNNLISASKDPSIPSSVEKTIVKGRVGGYHPRKKPITNTIPDKPQIDLSDYRISEDKFAAREVIDSPPTESLTAQERVLSRRSAPKNQTNDTESLLNLQLEAEDIDISRKKYELGPDAEIRTTSPARQRQIQNANPYNKLNVYTNSGQAYEGQLRSNNTDSTASTESHFGRHAAYAFAGLTAGVGITYALTRNRGQQSNAQLYGQQPLY